MPITLTDLIARAEGVLSAEISAETVLMSGDNGKYYCLTETSQEVWKQLSSPITIKNLLQNLSEKYQKPTSVIEADTMAFLESFLDKGLIKISVNCSE